MHLLRSLRAHLFSRQIQHVSKTVHKSLLLLWQALKPSQNVDKSSVPLKLLKSQKINLIFVGNTSKRTLNTFSTGKIPTCTYLKKTKTRLNKGSLCWHTASHEWSAWTVHVCLTHHMALKTRMTSWLRQHPIQSLGFPNYSSIQLQTKTEHCSNFNTHDAQCKHCKQVSLVASWG